MQAPTMTYRCPHCHQAVEVEAGSEGQPLVCPNESCKRPFAIDLPKARPAAELVLPGRGAAPAPDGAEPAPATPVAQPVGQEPEQTLRTVRLDILRRYPFRCLAYFLAMAAGVAGMVWFFLADYPFWAWVSLAAALGALVRFGLWWLRSRNTSLTVTTKRCVVTTGIMTNQVTELSADELDDVQVHQTFCQRLLGVGDLVLVTKHRDPKHVLVMAVPSPDAVADDVRRLTDR